MPASACSECPFRKQCPIKSTNDGRFTLEVSDKERRLAGRRVEEATEVFQERYAARFGDRVDQQRFEESSGPGAFAGPWSRPRIPVLLHKVAGWNLLRAAASEKLRARMRVEVAKTFKSGADSGPIARPLAPIFGQWDVVPMVLEAPHGRSPDFRPHSQLEQNQARIASEICRKRHYWLFFNFCGSRPVISH